MTTSNKSAVYRVQMTNGRFDHVAGKRAAIACAYYMAGAHKDVGVSPKEFERNLGHWGVTITRVSPAVARSVGL